MTAEAPDRSCGAGLLLSKDCYLELFPYYPMPASITLPLLGSAKLNPAVA
jgi:hypothetical protein